MTELKDRLAQWKEDNRTNPDPPVCEVRKVQQYATLIQSRDVLMLPPLADWFQSYNGRQTIEAGNKESKSGVFHVQHLMPRSSAGIQSQVLLAGLAANTVHWAMPWLHACAALMTSRFKQTLQGPKHIVRVSSSDHPGNRLQFASSSALPGVTLLLKGVPAFRLPWGFHTAVQDHN